MPGLLENEVNRRQQEFNNNIEAEKERLKFTGKVVVNTAIRQVQPSKDGTISRANYDRAFNGEGLFDVIYADTGEQVFKGRSKLSVAECKKEMFSVLDQNTKPLQDLMQKWQEVGNQGFEQAKGERGSWDKAINDFMEKFGQPQPSGNARNSKPVEPKTAPQDNGGFRNRNEPGPVTPNRLPRYKNLHPSELPELGPR